MFGSSIPLPASLGARRRRKIASVDLSFVPEAASVVVAVLVVGEAAHLLHWPLLPAVLVILILLGNAIAILRIAAHASRDARESENATLRMRRLYELTRRTLEMDLHVEPGPRLASLVHEIFEIEAVALFDADLHEVYEAGEWTINPRELVQNVYHFETSDDDRATGISRRVIRIGSVPIGSLVVRGETTPLTSSAVAALIAVTFDRYRAIANESRIEAERQTEQMRATVLDSLAHDYKTPLTAIRAASSGLSEMGSLSPAQADMVALIDEQATLLSDLTTRLLTTAHLESNPDEDSAAGFAIHAAPENAASLIEDAVASLADRSSGNNVVVDVPDESLLVHCDPKLMGMLLTQYLDNACKYSDFDTTITIRAARAEDEVLLSVHSFGPVIPMADRERIFDRYFRSSNSAAHASGTGIGLSVAKRVAMAHGGSVWVSSDETEGTTFFAALPACSDQSAFTQNGLHYLAPPKTLTPSPDKFASLSQTSDVERNLP